MCSCGLAERGIRSQIGGLERSDRIELQDGDGEMIEERVFDSYRIFSRFGGMFRCLGLYTGKHSVVL